jgi:pyochelin synthetase
VTQTRQPIGDLLASLDEWGVQLWVQDGQLRYRAPKGALTEERAALVRARREEIVAHLSGVVADEAGRYLPFPVTDVQAAYLFGRGGTFAYGGTGCHGYGELHYPELDVARLEDALNLLVQRHDMLRAVVARDGSQQVLPEVPRYHLRVGDDPAATRAELDHRVYQPDVWPLFEARVSRTPDGAVLHISIDFLIADFVSIQLLLDELHLAYHRPQALPGAPPITFRDYLLAERRAQDPERAAADRRYWLERLDELPPAPQLPRAGGQSPPRFQRHQAHLPPEEWAALRQRAGRNGITPSGAVLAAFAEVIAVWSAHPRFCLDLTLLNRQPLHADVNRLIGDFTGVELLAVDATRDRPFAQRARQAQEQLWRDLDHRGFSGVEVIREISRRQGAEAALFPVVFTSAIGVAQAGAAADGAPVGTLGYGISQTPQVWIDCQNIERDGGLATNWDVREGVLPDGVAEVMFAAYRELLRRLSTEDSPWDELAPVALPQAQRERRAAVNDTTAPVPDGLLHDGIVRRALAEPERAALFGPDRALSYGELLTRAGSVAEALRAAGLAAGEHVAVGMEKGWEQVVGVLGVLLAGGAYLPVEVSQPALRRQAILDTVGVRLLLTQQRLERHWPAGLRAIAVDTLRPAQGQPPASAASPQDAAYTIFTSGSTGTPKGVTVSHRSALNTVVDINERFAVTADDRVLGLASLAFDLSVYDIFGVLAAGGALVLPDPGRRGDPSHWAELAAAHRVTLWNSVPAQAQMLADFLAATPAVELPALRLALLSGDWIPVGLPDQLRGRLPGLRVVSLGGATEAAIWSIHHPIEEVPEHWRSIPYGTPLANQSFHVLDAQLRPCPDWVPGELYIGGIGLALGYLGDAQRTAERFVTDPHTGQRLYRTGDFGRYHPDGAIEFLGRQDGQVKIRGYRIELAEVEAALASHPAVGNAVVVVDGERPLERRLVAFVEPAPLPGGAEPAGAAPLRDELARAATTAGEQALAGVDRDGYLEFARRLDDVALPAMLQTLRGLGFFQGDGAHPAAEISAAPGIAERHRRLVRRWLGALATEGWLRADGDRYQLARTPEVDEVARAWQRAQQAAPPGEATLLDYFRASIAALPALLAGVDDPLALLFPQGQLDVSARLYEGAAFNRWANRAAGALVAKLAAARVGGGPLRILEVGAGGGGTTAAVLDALAGVPVEYTCTDLSPFFLGQLRARLGDRPDLRYALYDLDGDHRAQGLTGNGYHLVIAGDVLHATADVDRVLGALRELLLPGGWLVALEMTRDHYQIMTSLELLDRPGEATGAAPDARRGADRVFLGRDEWLDAFAAAGADSALCLPGDDGFPAALGMCVFAARFKAHRVPVDRDDLAAHLADRLPGYMLPAAVLVVDALPLTSNGKVDRAALRAWVPQRGSQPRPANPAPAAADPVEEAVAAIWAQALSVLHVGRTDNLFELGGDSLVAAQITGRVLEEVPAAAGLFFDELLRQLLEAPTVAAFTAALSAAAPASEIPDTALPPESASLLRRLDDGTVEVPDAALDPADLPRIGAEQARQLLAEHSGPLRLVGYGLGGTLAVEIARALADAGRAVDELVLVAPQRPAVPLLYAGDLVLAGDPAPDEVAFWEDLCLGEVTRR